MKSLLFLFIAFNLNNANANSDVGNPEELKEYLTQVAIPDKPEIIDVVKSLDCEVKKVYLPVWNPSESKIEKLPLTLMLPTRKKANLPLVIAVATIEGITLVEESAGTQLCQAQIASALVNFYSSDFPTGPEAVLKIDQMHRRTIVGIRTLIDKLNYFPEIDSSRIGVFGASLGGMATSLLIGVEPRIQAVGVVFGATRFSSVMAYGDNKKVSNFRRRVMNEKGIATQADYEEYLQNNLIVDSEPLLSPEFKKKTFVVVNKSDKSVPAANQMLLLDLLGTPNHEVRSTGHTEGIVKEVLFRFDNFLKHYRTLLNVDEELIEEML